MKKQGWEFEVMGMGRCVGQIGICLRVESEELRVEIELVTHKSMNLFNP